MTEEHFWIIVEKTTPFEFDTRKQLFTLKSALSTLSAAEIEGFEHIFDGLMRRSYTWELWGADYVIHGGASDDAFEYFRCWMVSKGKRIFELVSRNPDVIADILSPESDGPLEFEEFAYAAREVWEEKTGKSFDEMPFTAAMSYDSEPAGQPFEEDDSYLASAYPKLWKRFGDRPL